MKYFTRAKKYAREVRTGKIPACKYVKDACTRFEKDLKRKDIIFLEEKADKVCSFLEKLEHVKGKWAGDLFKLSDYQVFCTSNIFGFYYKKTNRRRYREAYIEVPRKNGKTFWLAGIALYMFLLDGEYGAEIYCGATSEKQALEVFTPARLICKRQPNIVEAFGIEVNKQVLNTHGNGSKFEPVIGNPGDGASPSCAIADEFHEHKKSDQVDTFQTGMGARENPIIIFITTAGHDTSGPCYLKRLDVIDILNKTVVDDFIFGIIYTIDIDDQWDTVAAQKKANPNYGVSVDPDNLKGFLAQARRTAAKQSSYKTKHLNVWVGAKGAWMNMLAFQACRKKKLVIEDYRGQPCFVGVDLASKIDIASMCVLFPPKGECKDWAAFFYHYLPEDKVLEGSNNSYRGWHSSGWLTTTPGNVIDFEYIEDDLKQVCKDYEVVEVPFDPYQATQFSVRMIDEGLPMIEIGATVKNFSEPMKEVEKLIFSKEINFNMDPVIMWMFGNVTAHIDKKENYFPNKEKPDKKIDGVVALLMAMNRAIHNSDYSSVYDSRGILSLS